MQKKLVPRVFKFLYVLSYGSRLFQGKYLSHEVMMLVLIPMSKNHLTQSCPLLYSTRDFYGF
jgi:hypothetical protein